MSVKRPLSLVAKFQRLRRKHPEADEVEFAAALAAAFAESKRPPLLAQRRSGRPSVYNPELNRMGLLMVANPSMKRFTAARHVAASRPENIQENVAHVLERNFKKGQRERIAAARYIIRGLRSLYGRKRADAALAEYQRTGNYTAAFARVKALRHRETVKAALAECRRTGKLKVTALALLTAPSEPGDRPLTLRELGVSKRELLDWLKLAEVPADKSTGVPRLGFIDNFGCAIDALLPLGIKLRRY